MIEIDTQEMRTAALSEAELEAHIATMTEDEKQHFKLLVCMLAQCYGEKPPLQGLVLIGSSNSDLCNVVSLNCTEMEGAKLLQAATDFLGYLNTHDAPPREKFN
jgi:hypothetical protein